MKLYVFIAHLCLNLIMDSLRGVFPTTIGLGGRLPAKQAMFRRTGWVRVGWIVKGPRLEYSPVLLTEFLELRVFRRILLNLPQSFSGIFEKRPRYGM